MYLSDTATTNIYTLSLHDALPISHAALRHDEAAHRARVGRAAQEHLAGRQLQAALGDVLERRRVVRRRGREQLDLEDRKSTRLNSSHSQISYAVFCLKKKNVT